MIRAIFSKATWDPRHPQAFYVLPHALILALILLTYVVVFLIGFGTGAKYGASYFRQHNHAFLHKGTAPHVHLPPSNGTNVQLPDHVYVPASTLPSVVDQWNTNSCTEAAYAGAASIVTNAVPHTTNGVTWHHHLLYSSLALYNWVNGTLNKDIGGNGTSTDQAELAGNIHGFIRHRLYDYPATPPVPFADAPPTLPTEKQPTWLEWLFVQSGGDVGDRGLEAIDRVLATKTPVVIDMAVYDGPTGLYQAGATGWMDSSDLTNYLGGHAMVIMGYDRAKVINGVTGWYRVRNSFGSHYGDGGYFWVSRRLVARDAIAAQVVHLGVHPDIWPGTGVGLHKPQGQSSADGGKKPAAPPPAAPSTTPSTGVGVKPPKTSTIHAGTFAQWYVRPFYARDSGLNIAPIVNAAGDHYNIWPVYLLAVIFAESGGNQYAWHDWGWPDISGGFTQETVQTLGGYGICSFDVACARAWETNATNSIWMGARILRDYANLTGYGYPFLWNAYNTGPGCHCTSPYYQGFLGNYYVALTYATEVGGNTPPPPPPTPKKQPGFPSRKWHAHTTLVPAHDHGEHLRWEALAWWKQHHVASAGGVVSAPQYFSRPHYSYVTIRFQCQRYWYWPTHRGWQKWMRVYRIGKAAC